MGVVCWCGGVEWGRGWGGRKWISGRIVEGMGGGCG